MGTGGVFLRKLRARLSDEPTRFRWVDEGRLAASGYPASRNQVAWVARHGINSILTLTEWPLPDEWLNGFSVSYRHIPMVDHAPPSIESLQSAAKHIESELRGGRAVLVHCLAGQGRTMCAIAAYLVRSQGVGAAEAIELVRRVSPGAVEFSQEKSIYSYAEELGIP